MVIETGRRVISEFNTYDGYNKIEKSEKEHEKYDDNYEEVEIPPDSSVEENINSGRNCTNKNLENVHAAIAKVVTKSSNYNKKLNSAIETTESKNIPNLDDLKVISVSEAIKLGNGIRKVKGIIISKSKIYTSPHGRNVKCINKECTEQMKEFSISRKGETHTRSWLDGKAKCLKCNSILWNIPNYARYISLDLTDMEHDKQKQHMEVIIKNEIVNDFTVGKLATVIGCISRRKRAESVDRILEAQSIKISESDDIPNNNESVIYYKTFVRSYGNIIDNIVELFLPQIVDLKLVKKALLFSLVNAGTQELNTLESFDSRIHILLTGSREKDILVLLKFLVDISNAIIIDASTTRSTITVDILKEDKKKKIKVGHAVLAGGSILVIKEAEQLTKKDVGYLKQIVNEGLMNVNDEEFQEIVPANTSLIASINGINGSTLGYNLQSNKWIRTLIPKFDFIINCAAPDSNSLQELLNHNEINFTNKESIRSLKQHLGYARMINPTLNDQAIARMSEYCTIQSTSKAANGIELYRKLKKVTFAIAKWSQIHCAGEQEVNDAIEFIESFRVGSELTIATIDPKTRIVLKCVEILKMRETPVKFRDLIMHVLESDPSLKLYIGNKFTISSNSRVREIAEILKHYHGIEIVREKPLELKFHS